MDRVEGGIPLHLSKREVCFGNHQKCLVLGIKLVICWSTSTAKRIVFLVLERDMSSLLEMLVVYAES
jgi:hypothetical protein